MTGPSLPWKIEDPKQREKLIKYYRKLGSMLLILSGSALMAEHLFTFDGFDIELLGHEWYGFGMIVVGFLLSMKWEQVADVLEAIRRRDILAIFEEGVRKKK
ncbi:MAG: hypothetical protein SVK08_11675 [Halobacteriota archaeon]|nr:hypothetical protein [Halobacteriota archaeon]